MGLSFYIVEGRSVRFDSSLTAEQREEIERFLVEDIPNRRGEEYIAYYDDYILDNYLEEASSAVREFLARLIEENGGGVNITFTT